MTSRVRRLALAALLALTMTGVGAQTIEAMVSPTTVLVRDGSAARMVSLPGKPVLYCGLDPFLGWSARLIGAALRLEPGRSRKSKRMGSGWR